MRSWPGIFLAALAAAPLSADAVPTRPPNILLIVTDDQNPNTIHAHGNEVIETPHLDRLAARGVSFTRAYAGYPICYASRAEILTGCTSFRALPDYPKSRIAPELATFAGTFREAGWHTWYVGKWHNDGHPTQRGYEQTKGLFTSGGAKGIELPEKDERGLPLTGYRGWTFKTDDGAVDLEKGVGLTPDISAHFGDAAVDFIESDESAQPFFLHVNFTAPHDPRLMPTGYDDRYSSAEVGLPKNFAPDHPFDHGNKGGRDEVLIPKPLQPDQVKEELAVYYAIITHIDEQIGRMMSALEAQGLSERTLVIFTSDQGLAMGSHGLMGKQSQYEHSIRSPLIIAGPQVRSGVTSPALCQLRDFFPTCCELAAIDAPETVQGRSLMPLLRGETNRVHEEVFGVFTDSQRMIANDRWKLIEYPLVNRTQLFDLQADPFELKDLSADPGAAEVREALAARLLRWRAENGDPNLP